MGDRSYMSIEFGSTPSKRVQGKIAKILSEWEDIDPAEIVAGYEYINDETSLGTAETMFDQIVDIPGCPALWAQQEARYEYDGDQHIHVPGFGTWEGEISSSGSLMVTEEELVALTLRPVEEAQAWVDNKTGRKVRAAWEQLVKKAE